MKLVIMPFGNAVPSCGFTVNQVIPSSVRTPEQLVPHVKHVSHTNGYYNLKANNFTDVRVRYFCTNFYEKTNGERNCSCAVTFARANVHSDWTVINTHDHSLICATKRLELFKTDVAWAISKGTLTLDNAVDFAQPIPSKLIDILVPLIPSSKPKTSVKKRSPLSATSTNHVSANVSLSDSASGAPNARSAIDVSANHASTSKLPQPRIVINLRGKHVASTSSITSAPVLQPATANVRANNASILRSASSRKRRCAEVNYNENIEHESTKRIKASNDSAALHPTSLAKVANFNRDIPAALIPSIDGEVCKAAQRPRRAVTVEAAAPLVTLAAGKKRAAQVEDIEETRIQPVKRLRKSLGLEKDSAQDTKTIRACHYQKSNGKIAVRNPKHIRGKLSAEDIRYGLAGRRTGVTVTTCITDANGSESDLDDICDSGRFDHISKDETVAKPASYATVQTLLDMSAAPFVTQTAHTASSAVRNILDDGECVDFDFPIDTDDVDSISSDEILVERKDVACNMAALLTVAEREIQQNEREWTPMTALFAAVDDAELELDVDML